MNILIIKVKNKTNYRLKGGFDMQSADINSQTQNSFNFSNITEEDLGFIQQAENQLNQKRQDKVVLIAYDNIQH